MADPKVDRLAKVPLFSRLEERELQTLASKVDEVSLREGKTLTTEGEPTMGFFILTSGNVKVTRKGEPIGRLGPGEFFGEIGMLDNGPATATVITEGPVEAMVLGHSKFRDAIQGNDQLALQVIAAMAERLRADALA